MSEHGAAAGGPLAGIRVLDLSAVLSGPMATAILADQGAEVIKVEVPGTGDLTRRVGAARDGLSVLFCQVNRGKRSIAVDLGNPDGLAVLHRLVERADVLVQNFRPGVAERLGVGYDDVRALRPSLVYTSIAGLGFEGPFAQHRIYDSLAQAMTGVAALQGDGREPAAVRTMLCDKVTALSAAQAITAALVARAMGAGGQHVRISMLDAVVAFLWPDLAPGPGAARAATPRERHQFSQHRDGWIACSPVSDAEFRGWCRALGAPEVADDPRWATVAQRVNDPELGEVRRHVQARARHLDVADVLERLGREGVSAVPVIALDELEEHPQVRANGTFARREHPLAGALLEVVPPARFSATPAALGAPAPTLGQHTDEVLGELGYDEGSIARLRAGRAVA